MKKGVTFFVFICLFVFDVSACGRENVSDLQKERKLRLRIPKLLIGHQKNRNKHRNKHRNKRRRL